MINPYEPTEHSSTSDQTKSVDWQFAAVSFVFVCCLLITIADPLTLLVPATRPWLRPRFGFSIIFLNPLIFLSLWYKRRDIGTMGAVFMLLVLAGINAASLLVNGTVSVVTNPFTESYHSAWFFTVLPPILFAGLLLAAEPKLLTRNGRPGQS